MIITFDDCTMTAYANTATEDGRKVTTSFEIYADDTVETLISRAIDKLSDAYLDMCSPLM